tara:strand:- start:27 stop:401 length:375 start_codon:yes stop_codon:yes gene_type:complete
MEYKEQMDKLSDEQKQKIIIQYIKVRKKANEKYNTQLKDDEEFIKKNRQFAKNYYDNNKSKKFEYYDNNKEKIRLKARYNYYKQKDRLSDYILKYEEDAPKFLSEKEINDIKNPGNIVEDLKSE